MEKTKTNTIFKLFGSFAFLILANLFSNNVYAEHSISVSTSGSQDINVLATTGVAISEAKVDVATTCHAGYNLTLSTTVDDNNLYLNGDESYRDNHLYFSPSNGTSSLNESHNTWGYYLPSSSTDIPTSSSIFNAVPTTGQIISLRTPAQTSRNTDINDSISVFYHQHYSIVFAVGIKIFCRLHIPPRSCFIACRSEGTRTPTFLFSKQEHFQPCYAPEIYC